MRRTLALFLVAMAASLANGNAVCGQSAQADLTVQSATWGLSVRNDPRSIVGSKIVANGIGHELATHQIDAQQTGEDGSSWKKGLLVGAAVGLVVGIAAHLLVDSIPCDSCSGTGKDSLAEGAGLEFALGFAFIGGGIGALVALF